MSDPEDEKDALSWAGDDDALPAGWTPVGSAGRIVESPATGVGVGIGAEATTEGPEDEEPLDAAQMSSATLVLLGVLGGIYLLYTLGWAIVATRVGTDATDAVGRIMFTVGNWLAVLATPLWFVVTLALTSERPRARVLWLVGGAVLLVPLPFILATGAAV